MTHKRLILSRARWLLLQTEFQHLTSLNLPELCQAILRWRHARGIPRHVNLLDGDAELLFDLANPLCIDAFLSVVSRNLQLELLELYPEPDEFWRLGGGHRVHEVVVPFVRSSRYAVARPRTVESRGWLHHRFPPGTDWLYVKLYGGRSAGCCSTSLHHSSSVFRKGRSSTDGSSCAMQIHMATFDYGSAAAIQAAQWLSSTP